MAFANIGLTPDRGVSYLLPRVVGLRRALTADEALGWSLVNAIADDQAEAAVHVARKISDGPAVALGRARRLQRSRRLARPAGYRWLLLGLSSRPMSRAWSGCSAGTIPE